MENRIFDIFAGSSDADALWVEAVEGLSNARERMEQIAAEKPGRYFVFCSRDHTILAQVETFLHESSSKSKGNAA